MSTWTVLGEKGGCGGSTGGCKLGRGLMIRWSVVSCLLKFLTVFFFFFQAEDGIRDVAVTGVQTCALPISAHRDRDRKDPHMTLLGRSLFALALLLAGSPAAFAADVKAGDLVITQPWSRATPGGAKTGAGYLTIENKGGAPDRLVAVSGDVAGRIEVHEMAVNNGVMTMRPLEKGLVIEPGKTVALA